MPRRNNRPAPTQSVPGGAGHDRIESGPDGSDYQVRAVPGARAVKPYRCPGCDHEIAVGVAHIVAWPADTDGADDRRHWHSGWWRGRRTRRPTR
ncbi:hypothetical protein [Jongsikchunia kroppenstedtii]|uniref:hypothetical protein n=1 Tax=Jongsikchunia kroppenstedtii TaxID=1121721 RepID=UPI00036ED995|nr:hypothetical protein [Jongsikchunia kroppenstedtii]